MLRLVILHCIVFLCASVSYAMCTRGVIFRSCFLSTVLVVVAYHQASSTKSANLFFLQFPCPVNAPYVTCGSTVLLLFFCFLIPCIRLVAQIQAPVAIRTLDDLGFSFRVLL